MQMSADSETLKAPNWLSELEEKRERRLKVRLGHEAGAGAPCLTCNEKCPGLDLHFWRKICKNCKCSKEDHDVHDDDIYGWAQFQLLGSKPNKIKKKITLPGKKDEVELDWAPKGHSETVDRFLQTLPPESLPVKGSQAAQDRKQLLQKQIPIHDIDPSLCHDLTETELGKMLDYVEHVKENSVGVGQIIQFAIHRGNQHSIDPLNPKFIKNSYGQSIPTIENVASTNPEMSQNLAKNFDSLEISDQKELDAFFDRIPNPANMQAYSNNNKLPDYGPGKQTSIGAAETTVSPIGNIRDLAFSTYDIQNNAVTYDMSSHPQNVMQNYVPNRTNSVIDESLTPNHVTIGSIRDMVYDTPEIKSALRGHNDALRQSGEEPAEPSNINHDRKCRKCALPFDVDEFAIFVDRSSALYHAKCFTCTGCNQPLADMVYFLDADSGDIYCGRDYAKIRGIPRCKACDELIFVKEYCLAESCTFHLKHFCCFECDVPLAGQNYVMEDKQPICLPCYERSKAERCAGCARMIKPNEQGCNLNGVHFHAVDECFACKVCKKPLMGAKLLLKNQRLYCSHPCFNSDVVEE